MTKGLPGSGKSTWAKRLMAERAKILEKGVTMPYKRINKDDLRAMLDDGLWSHENEKMVLDIRDQLVTLALQNGLSAIVDDTNLHPKHEQQLRGIAKRFKAEFIVQDFTGVPLEVCIARDLQRINSVGEQAIKRMHRNFLAERPKPRAWDHSKPEVILCDVDGTLALFGDKNPFKRDFENDAINVPVLEIVKAVKKGRDCGVFVLSGRSDEFEEVTATWLKDYGVPYDGLFMRAKSDVRKDFIIKKEIFDREIAPYYNVLFVLDDRNQVVDLWRSLGLTCMQVAPGDF